MSEASKAAFEEEVRDLCEEYLISLEEAAVDLLNWIRIAHSSALVGYLPGLRDGAGQVGKHSTNIALIVAPLLDEAAKLPKENSGA